jgi:lipid-A-disaccharide synthase
MARRMIKIPHVAMVNLLAGHELVPELLQQDCRPDKLAATVEQLLSDPAAAQAQRDGFRAVIESLRPAHATPSAAAAAEVLDVIDAVSSSTLFT